VTLSLAHEYERSSFQEPIQRLSPEDAAIGVHESQRYAGEKIAIVVKGVNQNRMVILPYPVRTEDVAGRQIACEKVEKARSF
jgi:hypothetical protein